MDAVYLLSVGGHVTQAAWLGSKVSDTILIQLLNQGNSHSGHAMMKAW